MLRIFGKTEQYMPKAVLAICSILNAQGYKAYLVGGAVRDSLRGKAPGDWDVATDALPTQVLSLFPKTIPTGIKYGTVTVIMEGLPVEVTTFRSESTYLDGRRPEEVSFAENIEEDLKRRDFTMNAIAYDPLTQEFVDPFGGRRDIRRRLVRTVGDPRERFGEDALRMLRFFRFLATLGFRPHRKTLAAIRPQLIRKISHERIRDELSKLLISPAPGSVLLLMNKAGLLQEILPELTMGQGVTQGSFHRYDVFRHSLEALDNSLPRLDLRWAALLHDVGKSATRIEDANGIHFYGHDLEGEKLTRAILTRLRYSKQFTDKVALLVRWHMFPIHAHSTDKALRRFIRKVGKDNILDLMEVRRADILALGKQTTHISWAHWQTLRERIQKIIEGDSALSVQDLAIGGREVMGILEIPPGPEVGVALEWLLDKVLDEPTLNSRAQLVAFLKSYKETSFAK